LSRKQNSVPFEVTAPAGCSEQHKDMLRVKAAFFTAIGYTPHRYQWDYVHARPERFNVQCWPRQHGKSTAAAYEDIWQCAINPGGLVWLVAPTYDLCEPIFDEICRVSKDMAKFPDFSVDKLSTRDMYVLWSNGAKLEAKSADNMASLQGRGLVFLNLDEWATVKDDTIYNQYLRPTLARWQAKMLAISTPKGFNQFFDWYKYGQDPMEKDWFSGRAPLGCSPYIKQEEIDEARRMLPDRVFRQEWEAEFIADAGAVFRGVKDCVIPGYTQSVGPEEGHFYAAGIDLAKHEDYSVIVIVDRVRKRQVYFDRFNEVDWHRQIPIFANIVKKYGDCPVLVDSTGVGDPIYDFMRETGMRVYGYDMHGNRKEDLINNLALSIERREVSLMDIPEQTNELIGYEYRRTQSGKLAMSAPGKSHDDCVVALALACWQANHGTGQCRVVKQGWRM
jgi:hypothetical protein